MPSRLSLLDTSAEQNSPNLIYEKEKSPLGEGNFGADGELVLGQFDGNVTTQVADLVVHLDALLQERLLQETEDNFASVSQKQTPLGKVTLRCSLSSGNLTVCEAREGGPSLNPNFQLSACIPRYLSLLRSQPGS